MKRKLHQLFFVLVGLIVTQSLQAQLGSAVGFIPTPSVITSGENYYLYNVEFGGFYVGDYSWNTRASVSRDKDPLMVNINCYGDTYSIGNSSPDEAEGVWIDGCRDGWEQFTFTPLSDGTYNIGCTKFPGTYLTWTGDEDNRHVNFTESADNGTWVAVTQESYDNFLNGIGQAMSPTVTMSKASAVLYQVDNEKVNQVSLVSHFYAGGGQNDDAIKWSSSAPLVASVDASGRVVAVGTGEAIITASATYEGQTYENQCKVTVKSVPAGSNVVIVTTPGTLAQQFDGQDILNIDAITIIGKLNGADIQTLRLMAGRDERGNVSGGMLSVLDMSAVEFVADGTSYTKEGSWTNSIDNSMTFPRLAFDGCNLNSITLPTGITSIGSEAFRDCKRLVNVTMNEGLRTIDYFAFYECSMLMEVEIPASVTTIESNAFDGCSKLMDVTFAEGSELTSIGSNAFYNTSLISITLPAKLRSISNYAFHNCNKLTTVEFEEGSQLQKIEYDAFNACYKLSSIKLPESVTEVGVNAFNGCPFADFYIPKNLSSFTNIGVNYGNLTSLTYNPDNRFIKEVDGILYATSEATILFVPKDITGTVRIDECVMTLPGEKFNNCSGITTLILPSKLLSIENTAFAGLSGLNAIFSSAKKMPYMDEGAFWNFGRQSDVTVYVPEALHDKYAANDMWSQFGSLVALGEAPQISLDRNALTVAKTANGIVGKTDLVANVISMGGYEDMQVEWASGNTAVATVDANGELAIVGEGEAVITATVNVNGQTASAECVVTVKDISSIPDAYYVQAGTLNELVGDQKYAITSMTIFGELNTDDIRTLRDMMGRDNDGNQTEGKLARLDLSNVNIVEGGESVYTITGGHQSNGHDAFAWDAFSSCPALEEIIFPAHMTELQPALVRNCENLKSVILPAGLTSLGSWFFNSCSNLQEVNLPAGLTEIKENTFSGCQKLGNINVHPDNTKYASLNGMLMDKDMTTLYHIPVNASTLIIPETVQTIDCGVIYNNVSAVVASSATPAVSHSDFGNLSSAMLIVPEGATEAYRNAENWSVFSKIVEVGNEPRLLLSENNAISLYNVDSENYNQKQVSATVVSKNGVEQLPVAWASDKESVATVTAEGLVQSVGGGTANITATITYEGEQYSQSVAVNVTDFTDGKLVIVETPGTLKNLLTEDEQDNLTKLMVMGDLDSDDVRVLRYMAGRTYRGSLSMGMLEYLDMSEANIVSGGEGYYKEDSWWHTNPWNEIGSRTFQNCGSLKHIILPKSVAIIGWDAFMGCSALESVVLPQGLYYISSNAFSGCEKLKDINIPNTLETIESSAFNSCKSLENVDFSQCNNLATISSWAFSCSGIKTVSLPKGLAILKEYTFADCYQLAEVIIPEGSQLESIEYDVFRNCSSLKNIDLSKFTKLAEIGSRAFVNTKLTEVYIPRSVTNIEDDGFDGCYSLQQITVHENNKMYKSHDGVLYHRINNNGDYELTRVPSGKTGTWDIPEFLTEIPNHAADDCDKLTTVVLHNKVTKIGQYAFNNSVQTIVSLNQFCPAVEEGYMGILGEGKTLIVPQGSKNDYAANDTWGQFSTIVEIGADPILTLSNAEIELFKAAKGAILSKQLTANVLTDKGYVTEGIVWASSDSEVATVSETGLVEFGSKAGKATVTATFSIDGKTVSRECLVTTEILPDDANTYFVQAGHLSDIISEEEKSSITDMKIYGELNNDDIRTLRWMAGRDDNNSETEGKLAHLDMSKAVIVEGGNGYYTPSAGTQYNSYKKIGSDAFSFCNALESIVLPEDMEEMNPGLLRNCRNLKSATLPQNLKRMATWTFYSCDKLESISLPEGVYHIGGNDFYGCTNLRMIISNNPEAPELVASAFENVSNQTIVLVPVGSKESYINTWGRFNNILEMNGDAVVTINKASVKLYNAGNATTQTLSASVLTTDGFKENATVSWSVADTDIASIDADGKLTVGTKAGMTTAIATYTEGGKSFTATCDVEAVIYPVGTNIYNVEQAGTLSDLISEEVRDTLKSAVITGKLNNADLKVIRAMAGRDSRGGKTSGMLESLDMANAEIVSGGGEGYLYQDGWWRSAGDNYIGPDLFRGSKTLKNVILPSGVYSIDSYAFLECENLESVVLPEELQTITYDMFNNTPKLRSVVMGNKLQAINGSAFYSSGIMSLTIPASVTSIGNYAFGGSSLRTLTFEKGSQLQRVDDNAFENSQLEAFEIPAFLTEFGFDHMPSSLRTITVNEANTAFASSEGVLYNKDFTRLLFVPAGAQTVFLKPTVTKIGDDVFSKCSSLNSIFSLIIFPPTYSEDYSDINKAGVTLYVPEGATEVYDKNGWKGFNIVSIGNEPMMSLDQNKIRFYNLAGAQDPVKVGATIIDPKVGISDAKITWTIDDTDVATVTEDGTVCIGSKTGSAILTATVSIDGKTVSAKCEVSNTMLENNTNAYFVSAGNLRSLISEEEKKNIKEIMLFGSMNGDDFRFLREMLGLRTYYWEGKDNSNLEKIDLLNVNIVSGGDLSCYSQYLNEEGNINDIWEQTERNTLPRGVFRGARTLKQLILPENLSAIGDYALFECGGISSLAIPETVKRIGHEAFNGLVGIYPESLIPATLSSSRLLGDDCLVIVPAAALNDYRNAEYWKDFAGSIYADNMNMRQVVDVTVSAERDGSGLLTAVGSDDALSIISDLTVHGTINSYDIFMIRNRMPRLHNLDLTDTKVVANPYEYYTDSHSENNRIGQNAFRELNKLRSVKLPNSIDYIGYAAFESCQNLTSVTLYSGINAIDNSAFFNCGSLKEITLPEGLLSIGSYAFHSCSSLQNVDFPSTLLTLESEAFYNCGSLKEVILPNNISTIGWYAFGYCGSLEKAVLPSRVRRIEYYAFHGCNNLRELRIPPMVESIGDRAFSDCNNIKDVYVYIANSKDIKIDMNTFSCWNTATLHIPDFSYNSYYWDTQWGQFATKVEFSDTYDEFYTKADLTLDNSTGVIAGNPDATIYEGGGLIVNEDIVQELEKVELKSDGGENGASLIPEKSENVKIKELDITINVRGNQWHFFCFPFDINLNQVKYDGEHVWRRYDGAARSRREGGWQDITENVLKAGRGYIFQGERDGELVMNVKNPVIKAGNVDTELEENEAVNAVDANWNFLGNPYTSYYDITEADYDAPVTVWTGNGYEAYRPGDDDYQFAPYQAFFVQKTNDKDSLEFGKNGRGTKDTEETRAVKARRARAKANPDRRLINLEVTAEGADKYTDKTRVVFNDNKSLGYEIDCDAAKFFSETKAVELFSIDAEGNQYSINERPVADGNVDMGITVNNGGVFSIAAVRMDIPVLLFDRETGDTVDLSQGSYLFRAEKGTSKRFVLRIADMEAVGIDNIASSNSEIEIIYDLSGRKVKSATGKSVFVKNGTKVIGE